MAIKICRQQTKAVQAELAAVQEELREVRSDREWLLATLAEVQDTNREQLAQAANERTKLAVLEQLVRRLWYSAAPHVDVATWPMEELNALRE
eukprot:9449233-Prorocentrum_lima.AAC.1